MDKYSKAIKFANNILLPLLIVASLIFAIPKLLAITPGLISMKESFPTMIITFIVMYYGASAIQKNVRRITKITCYNDLPAPFYGKRKYEITSLAANISIIASIHGVIVFHYLPLFIVISSSALIWLFISSHDGILDEKKRMMISKHFNPPI